MRGRLDVREVEDVGDTALSYAEVKALAAGDPRLVEQAEVSTEVARLERLERAWRRDQDRLGVEAARLGRRAVALGTELDRAREALDRRASTAGEAFRMTVGGTEHDKRAGAGEALAEQLRSVTERLWPGREVDLGGIASLGGFEVRARAWCTGAGRGADIELAGVVRGQRHWVSPCRAGSPEGLATAPRAPSPPAGRSGHERRDRAMTALPGLDGLAELDGKPPLVAALVYAEQGWPVLPVAGAREGHCLCRQGETCTHPGKHPLVPSGARAASASPDRLRSWWAAWPWANVGVVTGRASGLVVVDVDPPMGGWSAWRRSKPLATRYRSP
jgi:hypothetical protein